MVKVITNPDFDPLALASGPPLEVTAYDEAEDFLRTLAIDSARSPTSPLQPLKPEALAGPGRSAYELLGMLGQGAMGLVHLAKDRDLQRRVAYKQLLSQDNHHADNQHALARFLREAQITAQLDHPHIVPIYGMEIHEHSPAYSMKLVQGKTFKELIKETRAFYDQGLRPDSEHDLPQLLDAFLKVCDAVAYAHSKGVIHRDLKPANIMVGCFGEVYVMDWGIARLMHESRLPEYAERVTAADSPMASADATQVGQILGTPRYMSPQQAAGRNDELDGRSDLFALGLILYELLTLRPAFSADSLINLLKKVLKAEKEPWRDAGRKIAPELRAIVDKATARKPEQRYDGVTAMADDLRLYLRGEAPSVRPDNLFRRLARRVGRQRELVLCLLLGGLLCAAAGVIWHLRERQQALEQAQAREVTLIGFMSRVSQQGQRMDIHFQQMETLLQGLAEATTYALLQGAPGNDPMIINDAKAQAPRRIFNAPDLVASPHYNGEISPEFPVFQLAPGLSPTRIEPLLRRVAPLRGALKQVLMKSHSDGPPLNPAQWRAQLIHRGVPVLWAYIVLKEGVEYFYPGAEETTVGYDARKRPYYLQSLNRHELVWGAPYDDTGETGGLMIPCTRGIFDKQNRFLGTVGLDIRINDLDQAYLRQPDLPAIKASYLLNEKAEIALRSGDALKPKRRLGIHEQNVLKRFPQAEIVKAVQASRSSGSWLDVAQQRLLIYYRLSSLGWYYVVEADYSQVLSKPSS